jgi:hypothetical protein
LIGSSAAYVLVPPHALQRPTVDFRAIEVKVLDNPSAAGAAAIPFVRPKLLPEELFVLAVHRTLVEE